MNTAQADYIVEPKETVLVTGAGGFIGPRVVRTLMAYGVKKLRCFIRPTSRTKELEDAIREYGQASIDLQKGNLLSREDCNNAAKDVSVVYHLAAGVDKTFPGCFLNSVVTTRNLLDAVIKEGKIKRFVNVSSLSVYSNEKLRRGGLLDESCEVDATLVERHDPYAYGKAKQDEIVVEYSKKTGLPYVIVRPGVVFGPGKAKIPGRVGIDTFGIFLHLGLHNKVPLAYVDNCAEAIVLAGLRNGIDGEVINILDDELPTSRQFLRMYKNHVHRFMSIPLPYSVYYLLNYLWEKYSVWSEGQLPPVFNRRMAATYFKGNTYSNEKAKELLKWKPRVRMREGLTRYFEYARAVKERQ